MYESWVGPTIGQLRVIVFGISLSPRTSGRLGGAAISLEIRCTGSRRAATVRVFAESARARAIDGQPSDIRENVSRTGARTECSVSFRDHAFSFFFFFSFVCAAGEAVPIERHRQTRTQKYEVHVSLTSVGVVALKARSLGCFAPTESRRDAGWRGPRPIFFRLFFSFLSNIENLLISRESTSLRYVCSNRHVPRRSPTGVPPVVFLELFFHLIFCFRRVRRRNDTWSASKMEGDDGPSTAINNNPSMIKGNFFLAPLNHYWDLLFGLEK